jgi:hypothetical protein
MSEVWSLPGYDVQALLGFGANGEVWRARELASGDTVALKRLRPDADPAAVEALRREAVLLATLDTPYVVRLREVVGAGASAVLVLDHAAGGSLATLLARRGALDPGEVVTVGGPLAQALAAAHARGLVHGDVTPSNVLFSADGMPLLADLGVARLTGEVRGAVDGTAEYVDPAVAGGGQPDPAADVWALAAVCHHMLAGSPPHDGASAALVLGAAMAGDRAPLGLLAPTAPRALVAAVEAGLVPDPAARPDAAAFAALLRRAHAAAPVQLAGGSAAAGPLAEARETHVVRAAPAHAAPPRRRRLPPVVLLAAGLVVLLLAGAAGGWVWGRRDSGPAAALPQPARVSPGGPTAGPSAGPATAGPMAGGLTAGPSARPPTAGPTAGGLTAGPSPRAPTAGQSAGQPARDRTAPPAGPGRAPAPARTPEPTPAATPSPPAPAASSTPPAAGGAPAGQAPADWAVVLDRLDAARAQAFAAGDPARLAEVYAPGSAGLAADAALLRSLVDRGETAEGVRHGVRSVELLDEHPSRVRLRVVDVLAGYSVLDEGGVLIHRALPRGPQTFLVDLQSTPVGWRLVEVRPAAASSAS